MNGTSRRGRRLAAWIAAGGCAFWLLAQAAPADAQASRTRPGGGSSSSPSGGGGSSASSGGGSSSSSGGGPASVTRTRPSPPSSGGSQTVIDKRRPPSRGGHGGHGGHVHHGGYYGWPYHYGWWTGWSWWYPWGNPYGYGYPGYGHGPPAVYPRQAGPAYGALDTDVWPARTEVWINGQYVGFVDQFDGFPRFLWLEEGTYDVVFYFEGFKTLARQYTIYPGLVIDVEDRLERGEAIHPNDLAPTETPRRAARIEEERERRAEAEEPEWRARLRAESEAARAEARAAEAPAAEALEGGAWLYLRVTPSDAAVYLDGRFLGTARELSGRDTGIAVTAGRHELSVVRPGYGQQKLEFEAEAAGQVDLAVDLEAAG
jgi:hypothetical protein